MQKKYKTLEVIRLNVACKAPWFPHYFIKRLSRSQCLTIISYEKISKLIKVSVWRRRLFDLGIRQSEFCRMIGVPYTRFHNWVMYVRQPSDSSVDAVERELEALEANIYKSG